MTISQPGEPGSVPRLQPLERVSPSHFEGLQACPLREVWSAARAQRLLPSTPAAALGTAAHKLLEDAGRGELAPQRDAIERRWEEILARVERSASASWLDHHLVPLAAAVPDFQVRRLQAIAAAHALATERRTRAPERHGDGTGASGCEVAVATPDGTVGGMIDVVQPGERGPVIKDYKSGAIRGRGADAGSVKPAYAIQLKLYAAIYAAMTGTWPAGLELVPIAGDPEPVAFTRDECVALLRHAALLRDQINSVINSPLQDREREALLARPAAQTCNYCTYRPVCRPYSTARSAQPDAPWPLDIWGVVREQHVLGNGRTLLVMDSDPGVVHVRGLSPSPDRHPALHPQATGRRIGVFNLRPGGSPSSYAEGPFTVIYRLPDVPEA